MSYFAVTDTGLVLEDFAFQSTYSTVFWSSILFCCHCCYSPIFPKAHFLMKAEMVMRGKPLMAEKPMSLTAMLTMNMFGGVRNALVLKMKKNLYQCKLVILDTLNTKHLLKNSFGNSFSEYRLLSFRCLLCCKI